MVYIDHIVHTQSQEAHEKMLHIANYLRNANQNYNEVITSHWLEWSSPKSLQRINAGECGEKGTLLHCWWEYKLIQPLWKTIRRFLKKWSKTTMWPSNPTTWHIPWGKQNRRRHTYPSVHWSTIYSGVTEDEMAGWHHWLNGQEFEQTLEDSEGQGSLASCRWWGHRESGFSDWTVVQLAATPRNTCSKNKQNWREE